MAEMKLEPSRGEHQGRVSLFRIMVDIPRDGLARSMQTCLGSAAAPEECQIGGITPQSCRRRKFSLSRNSFEPGRAAPSTISRQPLPVRQILDGAVKSKIPRATRDQVSTARRDGLGSHRSSTHETLASGRHSLRLRTNPGTVGNNPWKWPSGKGP